MKINISRIENEELSEQIYQACIDAGFDDCGIISIDDMDGYIANIQKRIKEVPVSTGFYQGLISGTEEIRKNYPWAKSIVICLSWIGKFRYPQELQGMYAKGLFISRDSSKYGPEHLKKHSLGQWFDDMHIQWTGAIKENGSHISGLRHAAEIAGLGIVRKNNFLYNEDGSWIELDSFLIGEHCRLYQNRKFVPCPEKCSICQKSCPTGALCAPHTLNPFHCISFINTFGRGVIPKGLQEEQLGTWIVGCDACQDACPFNRKHDWSQGKDYPGLNDVVALMQPENVLSASDEDLKRICRLTADHLSEKDTDVLKNNAARVVRMKEHTGLLDASSHRSEPKLSST